MLWVGLWSVVVAFPGGNHVLLEVYFTGQIVVLDSLGKGTHTENTRCFYFTRQGFENTC